MTYRHAAALLAASLALTLGAAAPARAQETAAVSSFDRVYAGDAATVPGLLGRSIQPTADGGYVVTGVRTTTTYDIVVLRLDARGAVRWQRAYTVAGIPSDGQRVVEVPGGFALVAVLGTPGEKSTLMAMGLDSAGTPLWQTRLNVQGFIGALPSTLEATADGGLFISATDYDSQLLGGGALWAVKLDAQGGVLWQKELGVLPGSAHATPDGGAIAAGYTLCLPDCLPVLVKLDAAGQVQWQRRYLSGGSAFAASARPLPDGSYLVAGAQAAAPGISNAWLMRVDATGMPLSQAAWASAACGSSGAYDAVPTAGGGTLAMVNTGCGTGVMRLDAGGAIAWQRSPDYAGSNLVLLGTDFQPTADGGYVATGSVGSLRLPPRLLALKADGQGAVSNCDHVAPGTLDLAPAPARSVTPDAVSVDAGSARLQPAGAVVNAAPAGLRAGNGCRL